MNRWIKILGVSALVVGLLVTSAGGSLVSADEIPGNAVSGSGVGPTAPQQNPLGTSTMTSARKAASLKKVTLTWTQTGEAQGYVVLRKTGKGEFTEIARVEDGTPGTKSFEDTKVKPGTAYVYQVKLWRTLADGTVETGTCTNTASVKLVPGKVTGLKAKKGYRKIVVTWKKTKNISGYQVYTKVFVKGIKTKYSKAKAQKSCKYIRGMLVHGMKYGFKVRAYKKVNGKKIFGPFATVTKRY